MARTRDDGATALDREIEWAGLRFHVPRDWEIVKHSLDVRQGSLCIIDRRMQRLVVSWTSCRAKPDLEQLLIDHRSQLSSRGEASAFEDFQHGSFKGFSHAGPRRERVTRAVRFHGAHSRLVEALFVEPEGTTEGLFEQWLDRFELVAAPTEVRRWCAFDVDVTVPVGLRLVAAQVKPAHTTLTLSSEKGDREATIRRLGMARSWHQGELASLVRKHWPKTAFHRESASERAVEMEGKESTLPFGRVLGLGRVQRTRAWVCSEDDAVYELTTHSPRKTPLLPSDFRMRDGRGEVPCS